MELKEQGCFKMDNEELDAKWAAKEAKWEERQRQLEEQEIERKKTPLVERLRDSGPYKAGDGFISVAVGNYRDAHEAADRIEELTKILALIEDWAIVDFNEELLGFIRAIKENKGEISD
jgi:hypothetical protein